MSDKPKQNKFIEILEPWGKFSIKFMKIIGKILGSIWKIVRNKNF